MSKRKVSVIVPVYNAKRFITATVNALLAQTLKDVEILLMDDCSPDESAEIIKSVYANEERVRYYKMDVNGGPAKARNRGIELAEGEYISFLDSDDGIVPDALEKLYEAAVKFDADVVQSAGALVPVVVPAPDDIMTVPQDMMTKIVKDKETHEPMLVSSDFQKRLEKVMDSSLGGNVWGKLFKRSFLIDNHLVMPDLKMSEDIIMCMECAMTAERYVVTPYYSVIYRMIGDSLSKGKKTPAFMKKLLDATLGGDLYIREFAKNNPFFMEHKEALEQFILWMDSTMEDFYIRPCYQEVGKEALQADSEIAEVFKKYFGELAKYVELQFYQNHDQLPNVIDYFDNSLAYEWLKQQLETEKATKK